jgi:membrane-associated phospholipid phosphatase
MERNLQWKRKLLLSIVAIFVLAPFSAAIPCYSIPSLIPAASLISASMETLPFFAYVLAIAYYEKKKGMCWKSTILEAIFLNVIVLILKYAFNRPRPLPNLHTPGYPSGHAARAFWLAMKLGEFSKFLELAVLIYAVLVAWSRVELCVHYPVDVIGGAILAWVVREVWKRYAEPKLGLCGGPAGI